MRRSGILMHITSLPGPWGVGTMGKQAYAFADFLEAAGQRCWQVLPLSPTGFGNSPYQSCSAFAGNPYLIDLELLVEDGLLRSEEIAACPWGDDPNRVDFGRLYESRLPLLRKAFGRFRDADESFAKFRAQNDWWLPDYVAFMCLKDRFAGKPWYQWPEPYKSSDGYTLLEELEYDDIQFYCFVQYLFWKQWNALRQYCHSKGIHIIGDIPIYVPYDSVEVWANPQLFQLEEDGTPTAVAGVPPDYFSADGQLWGNPLYDWEKMANDGYSWWLRRLYAAGRLYDVVRLDHFRGLESYWAVPYGHETARNGHWVKGPGMDFIRTVKQQLPELSIIAEDLGLLTEDVLTLLKDSAFPGMKVLEFAFDSENSQYLPHNHTQNSVCYIGTHDNLPLRGWLETASPETVQNAVEYMNLTQQEGYSWGVIRTALSSVSELCVLQMQDLLQLGQESRMNHPGTMTDDNWAWRLDADALTPQLAEKLRSMTKRYGRLFAG